MAGVPLLGKVLHRHEPRFFGWGLWYFRVDAFDSCIAPLEQKHACLSQTPRRSEQIDSHQKATRNFNDVPTKRVTRERWSGFLAG